MYIVYNSDVSTDRTVTLAYELGPTDIVQHVALYLRNMIAEAFKSKKNLPWVPTDDFIRQSDVLPTELKTFLTYILFFYGRGSHSKSSKDCELSGTGHLQSSYKGATEKVHSVCFQ